jgi:hypothetical protein
MLIFYSLPYIPRLEYLFNPKSTQKAKKLDPKDVEWLNSLPFVIKNSLFIESAEISKLREMNDIGTLFFITDDVKIKGNKAYDLGRYYESLDVYEQVLACYIWLDFKDPEFR